MFLKNLYVMIFNSTYNGKYKIKVPSSFAEAKAFGATLLVVSLNVEGALATHVARQSLHVRLTEALSRILIADIAGRTT